MESQDPQMTDDEREIAITDAKRELLRATTSQDKHKAERRMRELILGRSVAKNRELAEAKGLPYVPESEPA